MKKHVWSGLMAAGVCALAVSVGAQAPDQTTSSQTRSSSQGAANQVTVTGCLQRASATAGATGTSGSTSSSSDSGFILTNAMSGGSSAASPSSSPSSAAGTSGSSSTSSTYKLDADDAKLTAHVGHKVEVTGTIESARPMGNTSSATSSTGSASASASVASNAPKLKVESVRMIAASCSE